MSVLIYIFVKIERKEGKKILTHFLGFNTFTRLPSLLHIASLESSRNLHPQRSWGGVTILKSICVEGYRFPKTFVTLCFLLRLISQVSLRFSVEKFASLPLESSVGFGIFENSFKMFVSNGTKKILPLTSIHVLPGSCHGCWRLGWCRWRLNN